MPAAALCDLTLRPRYNSRTMPDPRTMPALRTLPWRSIIRNTGVWICIGLVVSLALAWTLALVEPIAQYPRLHARLFVRDSQAWTVATRFQPGAVDQWWSRAEASELIGRTPAQFLDDTESRLVLDLPGGRARTITRLRPSWGTLASHGPYPATGFGSDTAFGFPFPAMWFQVVGTVQGNTVVNDTLHGGLLVRGSPSSRAHDFRALPLRIVRSGLIADSIVWGLSLAAIRHLVRSRRERARTLRGLCPRCAYDLEARFEDGCPECGWQREAPPRAEQAPR